MLSAAASRLERMLDHVEGLKVKSGAERLSDYLLSLCGESAREVAVTLPYEKSVLAAELGMKPESLSRAFSRLKAVGVITRLKQVQIRDRSALRDFARQLAG